MQIKKELNTEEVERISGSASLELTDRCPDRLVVFPLYPCTNVGCEYAIQQPGYMNCSFLAAEVGEHSLEAIGEMMGITREGIRKIEVRALKKVREALAQGHHPDENKSTGCKPTMATRRGDVVTINKGHQLKNQRNVVPAVNDRELGECSG